jgi:hypothetical protein
MNSHELPNRDPMDSYFRRRLKGWANSTHPPSDGRARLLWTAATLRPDFRLSRLEILRVWLTNDTLNPDYPIGPNGLVAQAKVYALQLNFRSVL